VPPHFYGEMSKTELGCQVLQEKGHFHEFAHFIKQHGHESEDTDLIMKLKSILWTVVCLLRDSEFTLLTSLRAMSVQLKADFLSSKKK